MLTLPPPFLAAPLLSIMSFEQVRACDLEQHFRQLIADAIAARTSLTLGRTDLKSLIEVCSSRLTLSN